MTSRSQCFNREYCKSAVRSVFSSLPLKALYTPYRYALLFRQIRPPLWTMCFAFQFCCPSYTFIILIGLGSLVTWLESSTAPPNFNFISQNEWKHLCGSTGPFMWLSCVSDNDEMPQMYPLNESFQLSCLNLSWGTQDVHIISMGGLNPDTDIGRIRVLETRECGLCSSLMM